MTHPKWCWVEREFFEINTENSKLVIDHMVGRHCWLCPMKELIMDHRSEFGAHRIHEDGMVIDCSDYDGYE